MMDERQRGLEEEEQDDAQARGNPTEQGVRAPEYGQHRETSSIT
jgi:hypothetical protein